MSTSGSWMTLKFRGVDVVRASRFQSSYGGIKRNTSIVSTTRIQTSYWVQPNMQFFSTKRKISTHANRLEDDEVQPEVPTSKISANSLNRLEDDEVQPEVPTSKISAYSLNRLEDDEVQLEVPTSNISAFSSWVKWVLNSLLSLILPFLNEYWVKYQKIEDAAEFMIDEADKVAEVVANVANAADKMSEDVGKMLPEGTGLKKVASMIESVAEQVAHDAQIVDEFFDKAEEVFDEYEEDLESFVEPIFDKFSKKETSKD